MQDWLTHRVRATPERTALVRAATGETLDFSTLDGLVDDLAGRLAALGVAAGDHLGMVMGTGLPAVCTVHAAERLGAVLVPLGDGLTAGELSTQVAAADVTTLVCSAATEPRAVAAFDGPICSVDDATHDAVRALGEVTPVAVTPATWGLADTRLLLFTSGTTGAPKVVRLTVGNLLWSAVASAFRLGLHGDDRWLVGLSLHHMGGLSPVVRMPLYGMTIVLQESFDAGRTADNIGNYDVTAVSLVPTMLSRMLDLRGTLAESLRVVLLGGAPAPNDLVERCRDFSIPLHPTYGMTETASQIATATPNEAFADIGTVGRPLFWTTVTVRDPDGGAVDDGETGEFVVDGPTVSPGYYDAPASTREAFGPDGLRTGDVGHRDENGRLYVTGRVDDRIITGGENVYPAEVVDALRAHPQVVDAAVVGLPDDEWGERVGALVVPDDDALTVAELDRHCRERLAGFKLPRAVSFADDLPRTESGTVERDAVREILAAGATVPDAETEAQAPSATDGPERDETDDPDDPATERAAGTGETPDIGDAEEAAARVSDAPDDRADDVLFGGEDWSTEPAAAPDDADPDADVVTDTPDEARTADGPPETPDFVQDALAVDETGTAGDATPAAGDETTADAAAEPADPPADAESPVETDEVVGEDAGAAGDGDGRDGEGGGGTDEGDGDDESRSDDTGGESGDDTDGDERT